MKTSHDDRLEFLMARIEGHIKPGTDEYMRSHYNSVRSEFENIYKKLLLEEQRSANLVEHIEWSTKNGV